MFIFALFALVFIQIQAREHHFALHYELKCHLEGNGTYRCEGKASSNDIKTRIHGSGEVNAEVHKLTGSVSHWKIHGVFDEKTGMGTEIGQFSFGVHTNHHEHSVSTHGQIISVYPGNKNHRHSDSAGWMRITGGKGTMKGATGGAAHSCVFRPEKDRLHCYVVGVINLA